MCRFTSLQLATDNESVAGFDLLKTVETWRAASVLSMGTALAVWRSLLPELSQAEFLSMEHAT